MELVKKLFNGFRGPKYMNLELYRAAQSGDWEALVAFSDDFDKATANGNNLLHILAQSGSETCAANATKQILERKPKLAFMKNGDGEIPLVIASRRGHSEVVRELIGCTSPWVDSDEDMKVAVIEAVKFNRFDVVKLFVDHNSELFGARRSKMVDVRSPLYVAVEKGYMEIATLMLSSCRSIACQGPDGKTVLHAAAIKNSPECMKMVLEKMQNLTKKVDKHGWTALHYAAKYDHMEIVKLLLAKDKSIGYVVARNDQGKIALHVAAINGHLDVMLEILSHCPECWEMTTSKRQNILHLAIQNEQNQVLGYILGRSWGSELLNRMDVNGKTPQHLIPDSNTFNPLDMGTEETDNSVTRQIAIRDELVRANANARLRRMNLEFETGGDEELEKANTYMVVATLIVTVTFAAGFTIPGGYDTTKENEGMAVLGKKAAFVVFIVSDSLAMMLSIVAVLMQLLVKDTRLIVSGQNRDLVSMLGSSKMHIALAMTSLFIAFISGLYAVIPVAAIKIYLIVMGSIFGLPLPLYVISSALEFMVRCASLDDESIV